jgi:Transcriptional regulator, AbiEi antitoxin, Type IV TA system/Transcriptional regulator, AbiEi antitoxin N-terminal domain
MSVALPSKLNRLVGKLPEGLLVDAAWMTAQGYSASLRNQYVAAGWLEKPASTLYRRPRGDLSWEQVVISLQMLLDRPLVVGGRTALQMCGFGHYLDRATLEVHLYGPEQPPKWISRLKIAVDFVCHNSARLFPAPREHLSDAVTQPWGQWNWPLLHSAPERAVLELLDELPSRESFHQVDKLFEGLSTLSPLRMQRLLEGCSSVKVKRLFFFFADRHQHAWLKHLNQETIDLGSGKRLLVRDGALDPVYKITIPTDINGHF